MLYRNGRRKAPVLLLPFHYHPATGRVGHPEGGRHGCRPFSDRAMDGESENGDGTAHSLSGFDVTRKVLSLVTFFAPAKKVTRRQAKASLGSLPESRFTSSVEGKDQDKIKGVSPSRARYFLLLTQKKVPKENGLLVRSKPLMAFVVPSPFSDSASCLGPKTPAIHGRRPTGVRLSSRLRLRQDQRRWVVACLEGAVLRSPVPRRAG